MCESRRLVGWLVVFASLGYCIGCGNSSNSKVDNDRPNENSVVEPAKPQAVKPQDAKPQAASAKEPLPPIDESLDIDKLLAARLSEEELSVGWIRLFDGQSLFGWRATSNADWRVEEGEIVVEKGEAGFLQTTSHFADFELHIEYQCPSSTNSGVFLRSVDAPTDPAKDCIELNIAPSDNPFPTASLVARQKVEPSTLGDIDTNAWHQIHALVDGDHIQVWFDGTPAVDYQDKSALIQGVIGLQFREGGIRFRNIRLRPILFTTAIPVSEPNRWKYDPSGKTKVTFHNGELTMQGGKGQVELPQPFADFCLQAEFKIEHPNTNSGIFFRCIPGEEMQGYECQIGHKYDQDRRRVVDFGMGGLFRRQAARAVLSEESGWTAITIAAKGNHFATWVQGVQVVDVVDDRAMSDNPRLGLRMDAGSIILQAHDSDCHIRFRKLQASELDAIKLGLSLPNP